ncbi:MAG: DUF2807 domain-containing protein [Myxococcales bacterium]|nr:DUF2807 domain-containing protein [Myxococcales bacterium]
MRHHLVLLVLASAASACAVADAHVQGSGTAKTEPRTTADFTGVSVGGAITLDVTLGPTTSITVSADDNVVGLITTDVVNGRLVVGQRDSYNSKLPVRVTITTPALRSVSVSGASTAAIHKLRGVALALDASGASTAALDGEIGQLTLDVSGASKVTARGLATTDATVAASGASQVEVAVARGLTVDASGASAIDYWGKPAVTKATSGVSHVRAH